MGLIRVSASFGPSGSSVPLRGQALVPLSARPRIAANALTSTWDVVASPETFGDGLASFRQLLFRRPLGEALVAASLRTWDSVELEIN